MLAPVVEQLAKEYEGKVRIVAADVDQTPETAADLGIMSIPAVVFFKAGKEVSRMVGMQPRQRFVDEIKKHFGV
jgi:thioredoxin 1